ncbi:DUF1064 domain-containing protein [Phenylobacterium sp. J367]|uniref:DUF1064 domain-containing protein n=1 Tax=Phenylobacterium sp. J367 TaxID=2898435 RepID=UPI002151A3BE|nr:DUF1064 domain-containing protein [Phenylobacterium sp. J367]MCR5876953.1 DUF1064 domain-containing protein [Phenylobacterium sp. J367]MCR5877021.1 DUF1064 domain-containing protein [Phenylobacterium sp. J367]
MTRPFSPLKTLGELADHDARRKTKYGNRKTTVGGIEFDSAKEAKRWGELQLLERAGQITNLRRQVPYPLTVDGVRVAKLIVDFEYREKGEVVVEDVKSAYTRTLPVWRLKSKLFKAIYGFPVREV